MFPTFELVPPKSSGNCIFAIMVSLFLLTIDICISDDDYNDAKIDDKNMPASALSNGRDQIF